MARSHVLSLSVALVALLTAPGCIETAVSQLHHGDAFNQYDPSAPIDILWVIDNSGTMSEEQDELTENFEAFTEILFQTAVDFHLGVTTTDVDKQGGTLVGEVLTRDTEGLEAAFLAQASQGIQGSRDEQPMEAISLATNPPLSTGDNAEIMRAEAGLSIIILTDEDDQSPGEVADYLDALHENKGETGFDISAIAGGLPAGCNSVYGSAEAATRIFEAVDGSGGVFKTICEPDFDAVMKSIALASTGMTDTFALTALPDLESMEVYVDGVLMHQRPHDGWQYDAADNAIVFDGYAIPRPGQVVEVDYVEITASDATSSS